MKTTLLLFFISIYSLTTWGQKIAVSNPKENVLWVGLPNPLVVVAEGYMCTDINVTASEGRLEQAEDDCNYTIYPDKHGKITITVSSKKKPGKVLGKMEFRVKRMPVPAAMIAERQGGNIQKGILKAQIGVVAAMQNFDINAHLPVTKYTITFTRGDRVYFSHQNTGAKFAQEVLQTLSKIATGDEIAVFDIYCKYPDGYMANLQPIRFRVID